MAGILAPTFRISVVMLLAGLASHALAELYRCDIEGVVVFSDQPCDGNTTPYTVASRISIVEPPADLDQVSERNQAFVRQRLDRLADLNRARAESASRVATVQPVQYQHAPATAYVPVWVEPQRHRHHRHKPEGIDQPPIRQVHAAQQRYSALSGPFPGTRRPVRER